MARIATITTIKREFTVGNSLENALANQGWTRMPGTGVILLPYRDANGNYRTGLDENAARIRNIEDDNERARKQDEIKKRREQLEKATNLDLSPNSRFWDFGTSRRAGDTIEPYKLKDGDNIFNLDDPRNAIDFYWISNHPSIARSLESWKKGDGSAPADAKFYVKNEEEEQSILYAEKRKYNDAIRKMEIFSLERRRQLARLIGLPVSDDSKEEQVYNILDDFLKSKEVPTGFYKGAVPVAVFNTLADLDDNSLYVRDLVQQAFNNNLYRVGKNNRIMEGAATVFPSRTEMETFFMNEDNQKDLFDLQKKLKIKKTSLA